MARATVGLPELVINPEDVSGSYQRWLEEFQISIEQKTLEMGTRQVDETTAANVFTPRAKLLALLRAIGGEGRDALRSKGIEGLEAQATYDDTVGRKDIQRRERKSDVLQYNGMDGTRWHRKYTRHCKPAQSQNQSAISIQKNHVRRTRNLGHHLSK